MDAPRLSGSFFVFRTLHPCPSPFLSYDRRARGKLKKERNMKKTPKLPSSPAPLPKREGSDVIAYRKTCKATGTGLSHYILMDKKAK